MLIGLIAVGTIAAYLAAGTALILGASFGIALLVLCISGPAAVLMTAALVSIARRHRHLDTAGPAHRAG